VIPVPVNTELGRIAEAVERILARRAGREQETWANLADDLEAVVLIAGRINTLYVDLLADIQSSAETTDDGADEQADPIQEVRVFLRDDHLIGLLTELHGRVQAASQNRNLRRRRFREVVAALRGLERAIDAYLNHLRAVQGSEAQTDSQGARLWNLSDVLKALEGHEQELSVPALCEEAIRNRRNDLTYAIDHLAGVATQHIRFRRRL
jgi:hypothetical protein